MTIIQVIQKLRDDLKLWVTNNLRVKMDKNLGAEESGKILAVDENGDIITIENVSNNNIYIQTNEPENPKDGDLWVDTDDEEQTVLATVAASGSFNDLSDKPTYGIADITNLQTELDKLATQVWVQQQIAAIAIYDGSVS